MKFLWGFIISLLFLSCQDIETVDRPENLIPEQKMVEVLTDLSLLNSAKNYNKRSLENTGFKPAEYLYQKHNVDSVQLAHSTQYYARNYTTFENIYKKVQRNLEKIKVELEVRKKEEERIKDSIQLIDGDSIIIDTSIIKRGPRDSLIISETFYEEEKS